jgi:hypothetical protein
LGGAVWPQSSLDYYDILVIRTDSAGNLLWSKIYSDSNSTDEVQVVETFDKNILIASRRHINHTAGDGIQFIKTDSIGNIIWSNQYYGDSLSYQHPRYLLQTPDSGFLINSTCYGYVNTSFGYSLLLLKTDKNGNMHWSKIYKSFAESYYSEIQPDHDIISSGIVIIADTVWEPFKAGILRTDNLGNVKWCRRYSSSVHGRVATRTPDNGFLLNTAVTQPANALLVIKTDSNGISGCDENEINEYVVEPIFTVTPAPMLMNSIILNTLDTTFAFSFAQKFTADCIVNTIKEFLPENHFEIIPNPSSRNFIIKPLNSTTSYDLEIYNSSGILVHKHSNVVQEIYIDNKDLKAGLYIIKLSSSGDNFVEKLIIID